MTGRLREAVVLAASGAVLGLIVGLMFRLVLAGGSSDEAVSYGGDYVPISGPATGGPYESTLSISVDPSGTDWWEIAATCAVGGVVLGLLVFGVLLVTKRRIALVSGSSPTG